jgi:hypothetical protein
VLHGKGLAKAQRTNYSLAGNRIDRALRNCWEKQTIGVPIGPDTSHIVAELILSGIDVELQAKFPRLEALRYLDDYEFAVESHDQAESIVAAFQELLSAVELELNETKTEVLELPTAFEYPWVSELRALPLRATPKGQRTDLVRLFDKAFEHAIKHGNHPVLRYLMGRLTGIQIQRANWKLFRDLLLQCMTVEPGTIAGALSLILANVQGGYDAGRNIVEAALNAIIIRHSSFGHGSEVAWALWGLMSLGFTITGPALDALEKIADPIVALLTLHAARLRLCQRTLIPSVWSALMKPSELYDANWLLAYEALVRGWLPPMSGRDYVRADPGFSHLQSLRVRFYNEKAIGYVRATGVPPSVGLAPVFYAD